LEIVRGLRAVERGWQIARHFHSSLGLGDFGFEPLFHDLSPFV
jgi:hypothetical protein